MALADDIVRVSPGECEALLDQACRESWTELIVLGPTIRLRVPKDDWPEDLKAAERIFQLRMEYPRLVEKVIALSNLSVLNLWGNKLEHAEVKVIAQKLGALTSLDLSLSDVRDDGASAIASSLPELATLSLRNSNLSDAGATAISSHLSDLRILDLSFNRIGEDGAIAISKDLQKLTALSPLRGIVVAHHRPCFELF